VSAKVNTLRLGQLISTPIQEAEMNNTRISNPVGLLSFAAVVFLALAIGFIAWLNLASASIDLSGLTLPQVSRPETFVLDASGANTQGLAIYHQSERSFVVPRVNPEGLALYRESERGNPTSVRIKQTGLETYWQSERFGAIPKPNEEGMSIYLQSERNIPLAASGSTDEGMEIYYASERER
jgi:hypothetical protein